MKDACALTQLAKPDERIKVPSVGDRPPRDLSRKALAEVVEPRYEELFTLVQAELRRSGFEDLISAGIVMTGGSSKMEGVLELAEAVFHMPVRLGTPKEILGLTDAVIDPIYSTAIGLLLYGQKELQDNKTNQNTSSGRGGGADSSHQEMGQRKFLTVFLITNLNCKYRRRAPCLS